VPELSIVMPCSNAEQVLPATLTRLDAVVGESSLDVELILLDDESEDATVEVARTLGERFPSLRMRVFHRVRRRRGYGAVVRFGMAHATGRYCCFVAADGRDPVELLPALVGRLRAGAHHVQVSRYLRPEDWGVVPRRYRAYQAVYRTLVRLLLARSATDSTYAFRAFHRAYVMALGTSSNRFDICPEITFKMMLSGARMEWVPGRADVDHRSGSSRFQLPLEIPGYLYVLLRAGLHRAGVYWF
jgi:dolichol-phosphate mannosyltransferase